MCRVQSPGFGETETGKFNLGVLGLQGFWQRGGRMGWKSQGRFKSGVL